MEVFISRKIPRSEVVICVLLIVTVQFSSCPRTSAARTSKNNR
jgi:hypothetical protein